MDFASTAIETAREIRDEGGLTDDAEFACCDVYDAPDQLDREFDVVFASYGVLCWIPDLERWAETAVALCRPGRTVFLADMHPILNVFDWKGTSARIPFGTTKKAHTQIGMHPSRIASYTSGNMGSWR